jgi:hypothetical protein
MKEAMNPRMCSPTMTQDGLIRYCNSQNGKTKKAFWMNLSRKLKQKISSIGILPITSHSSKGY